MSEVISDRSINFFESERGKIVGDTLGPESFKVCIDDRIQRHTSSGNSISALRFLYVMLVHHCHSLAYSRATLTSSARFRVLQLLAAEHLFDLTVSAININNQVTAAPPNDVFCTVVHSPDGLTI